MGRVTDDPGADDLARLDESFEPDPSEPRTPFEKFISQPVHDLSPPKVVSVEPGTPLRQAIDIMQKNNIGAVVIVEGGKVAGIFTERDFLMRVAGHKAPPVDRPVSDFMTHSPECLTDQDPIAYALNKMCVGGYRHVPIVDKDGKPIGIVSMREIVEHLTDVFPRAILNLPPEPRKAFQGLDGG